MKLKELILKNIGPFRDVCMEFSTERDNKGKLPVTIITGENGTGKTIILDSIRAILKGPGKIERDITSNEEFLIKAIFIDNSNLIKIDSSELSKYTGGFRTSNSDFNKHFSEETTSAGIVDWIITYWTSKIPADSYKLESLISPKPESYLLDSLSGVQRNVEITALICYFDYLKSSDDLKEKGLGEFLFDTLKKIIKKSLLNGELKYVARKSLDPIFIQNGQEVTLEKLSSGNLFLIQRLVSLLGKMYSVFVLNNKPLSEFLNTSGILLIDEAENHLHPKWQKTFIDTIQEFFPNLQIILTTHSPFIVASVRNSKIFVSKPRNGYSEIVDETDEYSNIPIDEILLTPVFETQPFNADITNLLKERKEAISINDDTRRKEIEKKLLEINPGYFSFIEIEEKLKSLH